MSEDHLQALPNGRRIGEYEIIRVLGAGGFGITYLAFDHNLQAPVAFKEYFYAGLAARTSGDTVAPSSTSEAEGFEWGRARFLDEARLLAGLDHPNVVRVHRCLEANNTAYIVMDYVEGESLAAVLEKHGTLTPSQWRRWLEPLLDGLEYVHRHDYLHRDIKPANIVIRAADGQPILIDFGSARRAAGEKTRHLTAVHTPGYAPIEQYSASSRQGPATDIYGLAAVSYRALTGEPPLAAPDRMLDDGCRPMAEQIGGADGEWLATLDRGLALRPEDRPETVAAWRAALADGNSRSVSPADTPPRDGKDESPLRVLTAVAFGKPLSILAVFLLAAFLLPRAYAAEMIVFGSVAFILICVGKWLKKFLAVHTVVRNAGSILTPLFALYTPAQIKRMSRDHYVLGIIGGVVLLLVEAAKERNPKLKVTDTDVLSTVQTVMEMLFDDRQIARYSGTRFLEGLRRQEPIWSEAIRDASRWVQEVMEPIIDEEGTVLSEFPPASSVPEDGYTVKIADRLLSIAHSVDQDQ